MDAQNKSEASPPYQIIEDPAFSSKFKSMVPDDRMRDELTRIFYAELPNDPGKFPTIPGVSHINLKAVTIACFPPLTLFFTINERIIKLVDIA